MRYIVFATDTMHALARAPGRTAVVPLRFVAYACSFILPAEGSSGSSRVPALRAMSTELCVYTGSHSPTTLVSFARCFGGIFSHFVTPLRNASRSRAHISLQYCKSSSRPSEGEITPPNINIQPLFAQLQAPDLP